MTVFQRGQQLSKNDLFIFVYDNGTRQLTDPFSVTYAVYDRTRKNPVPIHRGHHRRDREHAYDHDAHRKRQLRKDEHKTELLLYGDDGYDPFQLSINQDQDALNGPNQQNPLPPFQVDHHDPFHNRPHEQPHASLIVPEDRFEDHGPEETPVLVGNDMNQVPTRQSVGFYWANIRLDEEDNLGEYEIVWAVKLTATSETEITRQRFSIVSKQRPLELLSNTGGVAYYPGQILGPKELYIQITNERGNPADPYSITYAVYDKTTGMEILMGSPANMPVKLSCGKYYANYLIPDRANVGDWVIRWSFVLNQNDTPRSVVQEFAVVQTDTVVSSAFHEDERALIRSVRFLLRDNNPDRNYRFVPPDNEKVIQNFTETFGFMWTDEEIYEYLLLAIDAINFCPPIESHTFATLPRELRSMVTMKAASYALTAISINWIHDEFDYNIGGVSLQIEKSSKFQGMGEKLEQEYQTAIERYKDFGVKYVKGIQQPRYGIGVSSALGPFSGRGVQARRNFIASTRI